MNDIEPLVGVFGSREAVTAEFIRNLGPLAGGEFEVVRQIGGQSVIIRGAVIDGVPLLGTAFTP